MWLILLNFCGCTKELVKILIFLFEVNFYSTNRTAVKDQITQMQNYIYLERLCCYFKQYKTKVRLSKLPKTGNKSTRKTSKRGHFLKYNLELELTFLFSPPPKKKIKCEESDVGLGEITLVQ